MFCILIWLNEDTITPSAIGPYPDNNNESFDAANRLKPYCHKVLVTQISPPDELHKMLAFRSTFVADESGIVGTTVIT